jgi:hypothetical protein
MANPKEIINLIVGGVTKKEEELINKAYDLCRKGA